MRVSYLLILFLINAYGAQNPAKESATQQIVVQVTSPSSTLQAVAKALAHPQHKRRGSMPTKLDPRGRSSLGSVSPSAAVKSLGAQVPTSFGVTPLPLSRQRSESRSKPQPLAPVGSPQNSARDRSPIRQTAVIGAGRLPGEILRMDVAPLPRRSCSAKSYATHMTDDTSPTKVGQHEREDSKKPEEEDVAAQEKTNREKLNKMLENSTFINRENLLMVSAGSNKNAMQNYLIKCLEDAAKPFCSKHKIKFDESIKNQIKALIETQLTAITFKSEAQSPPTKHKSVARVATSSVGTAAEKGRNEVIRQSWHTNHTAAGSPAVLSRQPTAATIASVSNNGVAAPKKKSWFCCCASEGAE